MAIISAGYDGSVDEVQFAQMISKVGTTEYGVSDRGEFRVTAVAGQDRTLNISDGTAWGMGVFDVSDSNVTVQLDPVTSGSRWDLIVLHRDWQPPGGATTVKVIKGGSSMVIPARANTPGVQDDQPIALVRVQAGSTSIAEIVDLRVWARNGGALARHDLVRSYFKAPGTVLEIFGTIWISTLSTNGTQMWVNLADIDNTGWMTSGISLAYSTFFWRVEDYKLRRKNKRFEGRINLTYKGSTITATANDVSGTRGNIEDIKILEFPAGYRPTEFATWPAKIEKSGVQEWFGRIQDNGNLVLTHGMPGAMLEPGDTLRVYIDCPLD
jgi:hypothetical protein